MGLAAELAKPFRLNAEESSIVGLFKANTPSVVYITNLAVRRDQFTLDVQKVPQVSVHPRTTAGLRLAVAPGGVSGWRTLP